MTSPERQRLDKWLFFARVVRSRALATRLVQAGRIRINGTKTEQAAHPVKTGDALTIALERKILIYRVTDCGSRRGPAAEARLLYEDLTPAPAAKTDPLPDAAVPRREAGSGRPTKKQRRQTDRFREGN